MTITKWTQEAQRAAEAARHRLPDLRDSPFVGLSATIVIAISARTSVAHVTRRFSTLSLPLFGTMSKVTLAPSRRSLRPAFATAEMWTNTSFPPPPSGAMKP
jgi:hypothetical protein